MPSLSTRVQALLRLLCVGGALLLACAVARAAAFEPGASIRAAAEHFVRAQLPLSMRARARIRVDGPAPALRFPRCARLHAQAFGTAGLFGPQTVEVICAAPKPWSLYLPVQVDTPQGAVLALHALDAGHVLRADDLTLAQRDLASLPAGTLDDLRQGVGQVLRYSVAAGQAITRAMLRGPRLVHAGQSVPLIALAPGVRLSALGVAMQDGSQGQTVMARNAQSGRIVHGVIDAAGEVVVEGNDAVASNP